MPYLFADLKQQVTERMEGSHSEETKEILDKDWNDNKRSTELHPSWKIIGLKGKKFFKGNSMTHKLVYVYLRIY